MLSFDYNFSQKVPLQKLVVLPPRIELGIYPYHGHVIPFNYRSVITKSIFIDNKAFFSNYCLNFLTIMIYILFWKFYGHSLRL